MKIFENLNFLFNFFILKYFFQDYLPDSDKYFEPIEAMARSKPQIPIEEILEATKPEKPCPFDHETDMPVGGDNLFYVLFSLCGKIKSLFM
jgi:beta-amylase